MQHRVVDAQSFNQEIPITGITITSIKKALSPRCLAAIQQIVKVQIGKQNAIEWYIEKHEKHSDKLSAIKSVLSSRYAAAIRQMANVRIGKLYAIEWYIQKHSNKLHAIKDVLSSICPAAIQQMAKVQIGEGEGEQNAIAWYIQKHSDKLQAIKDVLTSQCSAAIEEITTDNLINEWLCNYDYFQDIKGELFKAALSGHSKIFIKFIWQNMPKNYHAYLAGEEIIFPDGNAKKLGKKEQQILLKKVLACNVQGFIDVFVSKIKDSEIIKSAIDAVMKTIGRKEPSPYKCNQLKVLEKYWCRLIFSLIVKENVGAWTTKENSLNENSFLLFKKGEEWFLKAKNNEGNVVEISLKQYSNIHTLLNDKKAEDITDYLKKELVLSMSSLLGYTHLLYHENVILSQKSNRRKEQTTHVIKRKVKTSRTRTKREAINSGGNNKRKRTNSLVNYQEKNKKQKTKDKEINMIEGNMDVSYKYIESPYNKNVFVGRVDILQQYGLYARRDIKEGEIITYLGKYNTLTKEAYDTIPNSESLYLVKICEYKKDGQIFIEYVDAKKKGNTARFANHSTSHANSELIIQGHKSFLRAKEDIPFNRPIYFDYGCENNGGEYRFLNPIIPLNFNDDWRTSIDVFCQNMQDYYFKPLQLDQNFSKQLKLTQNFFYYFPKIVFNVLRPNNIGLQYGHITPQCANLKILRTQYDFSDRFDRFVPAENWEQEGITPLMIAATIGTSRDVATFLEYDADPNIQRIDTWETALFFALTRNEFEEKINIIKLLLQHNININLKNKSGDTALQFYLNNKLYSSENEKNIINNLLGLKYAQSSPIQVICDKKCHYRLFDTRLYEVKKNNNKNQPPKKKRKFGAKNSLIPNDYSFFKNSNLESPIEELPPLFEMENIEEETITVSGLPIV